MNLYHKKQRWKIALLGAAILLVVASIWFSYTIVSKVQQREVDRIKQWADSVQKKSRLVNLTNQTFEQLGEALSNLQERDLKMVRLWALSIEEANRPLDDYSYVVRILQEVSTVPMIVTDMNEKVVSGYNLPQLDSLVKYKSEELFPDETQKFSRDSFARKTKKDSLQNYVAFWKTIHDPIIMDLYGLEKQKLFYFDSVFVKTAMLSQLKHSRDSLVDAFSNELVTNEYLVPVLFIDSDSRRILATNMPDFVAQELPVQTNQLNEIHDSIIVDLGSESNGIIYFKHSPELIQMKYFPFVQFGMIGLFILIAYLVFSTFRKAEQDQVWVGMAKETAHQLGTPISSLMAWNEILSSQGVDQSVTKEIEKDILRLNTITNRFSKIGSEAILEEYNVSEAVKKATDYLRSRISSKVDFQFIEESNDATAMLNPALLEWAIENIVKNAVDATEGAGKVEVKVHPFEQEIFIDISDNGKGIVANKIKTVFQPGFTTKKRGWGLGLSLVKRIIEDFHKGKVFVLKSEPGVGTTFRIILNRNN